MTGKKDAIDATSAALEVLPDSFKSFAKITLEMCAYAGSGDVLVIQELLHTCSESQSYVVGVPYLLFGRIGGSNHLTRISDDVPCTYAPYLHN